LKDVLRRHGGLLIVTLALLLVILVPFGLYEAPMTRWADALLRSEHASGVVALAVCALLAADILLPVPSSLVNTAAGVLLGFWAGALASWVGLTLGCVLGYVLGSRAAHRPAERLIGAQDWETLSALMTRFGPGMVVLCRAVPVLAEASVLTAGLVRTPFRPFLLRVALANLGIAVVYAAVGAYSWNTGSFLLAVVGALLLPLVALGIARRFAPRPL
jgi:uncharacterized membrane protein YdjX (TVP38/TMEM64 family)